MQGGTSRERCASSHPAVVTSREQLFALPRFARPIVLTASECERLKKMAYGHKTEHRLRQRAQIVLHAVRDRSNAHIARETGLHLDTVRHLAPLLRREPVARPVRPQELQA
ncbi:hypothetical protein ACGF8D_26385 [Streptomyces massasporeus]|uniref:hypothetical protein n=1 Tax=Streptomyces massasporeus TaxID=67324 RepID=UPI003719CBAD